MGRCDHIGLRQGSLANAARVLPKLPDPVVLVHLLGGLGFFLISKKTKRYNNIHKY